MAGFITVTVRDYKGKTGHIKVETTSDPTQAKAKQLADFIEANSAAQVVSYGIGFKYTSGSTATGKYDRVLQNLVVTAKDAALNTRLFSLLAPKDSVVGDAQTAKQAYVTALFNVMSGIDAGSGFVYSKSGLKSRLPREAEQPEA